MLRRAACQRPVPATLINNAADVEMPEWLPADRQRVLPCQPSDFERRVLSQRTNTERTKQKPMQAAAHSHSGRTALPLRGRTNSDRQRQVLSACERDDERRMLFGTGRSDEPHKLPGSSLRGRLYENAGRQLLQQPLRRPRWKILQCRRASVWAGRVPRPLRRVRPDAAGDGLRTGRGAKACGRMRGGAGASRLPGGRNPEPSRQVRAERSAAPDARPQGAPRWGRAAVPRRPETTRYRGGAAAPSGFTRSLRRPPRLFPGVGVSRQ